MEQGTFLALLPAGGHILDFRCGVWACSSILHVAKAELPGTLARIQRALKPGGVLYTSFKHGEFEGM